MQDSYHSVYCVHHSIETDVLNVHRDIVTAQDFYSCSVLLMLDLSAVDVDETFLSLLSPLNFYTVYGVMLYVG